MKSAVLFAASVILAALLWVTFGGRGPGGLQAHQLFLPVVYPVMVLICAALAYFLKRRSAWALGPLMLLTQLVLDLAVSSGQARLWLVGLFIQAILAVPLIAAGLIAARIASGSDKSAQPSSKN